MDLHGMQAAAAAHIKAATQHRALLALHQAEKPADDAAEHIVKAWLARGKELADIAGGHEQAAAEVAERIKRPPEPLPEVPAA